MISQPKTSASRSQFKFPLIHQKLSFENFDKWKMKNANLLDPSYSKINTPPLVSLLNGPSKVQSPFSRSLYTVTHSSLKSFTKTMPQSSSSTKVQDPSSRHYAYSRKQKSLGLLCSKYSFNSSLLLSFLFVFLSFSIFILLFCYLQFLELV